MQSAASRAGIGRAALVEVRCTGGREGLERAREAHAHLCADRKIYFPLQIREDSVRFVLTDDRIKAMQAYMSSSPHELLSAHADTVDAVLTAAGAAALGAPSCAGGVEALPVRSADIRYSDMGNAAKLSKVVSVRPGLGKSILGTVLEERMQAAHASLLAYLTLLRGRAATGLGIAMAAASFEVGSRLGLPVAVEEPSQWARAFSLSEGFETTVRSAFSFQALSTLLPELLPKTGYEHHEMVLSSFDKAVRSMGEGTFGDELPENVRNACGRTVGELNSKGEELYPYVLWD
jgi:hypothetical protein